MNITQRIKFERRRCGSFADKLLESRSVLQTDSLCHRFAFTEEDQRGNAHDAELSGECALFVYVDLADLDIIVSSPSFS